MQLSELTTCLGELYRPDEFKDYISPGLLIQGKEGITSGATAVSFNIETAKRAVQEKVDFLVVHHGHGFWDNQPRPIVGGFKQKVSLMLQNQINLFAYHLPMDAQPEWGNNIQLLRALGLTPVGNFLPHGRHWIGAIGSYPEPLSQAQFLSQVEACIGNINFNFMYGSKIIRKVAICTGGAASSIREAMHSGADLYLTGEAKEDTHSFCQDEKFNFIAAGHHKTEVFGPKALAKYLSEKKIPTKFIDVMNPV